MHFFADFALPVLPPLPVALYLGFPLVAPVGALAVFWPRVFSFRGIAHDAILAIGSGGINRKAGCKPSDNRARSRGLRFRIATCVSFQESLIKVTQDRGTRTPPRNKGRPSQSTANLHRVFFAKPPLIVIVSNPSYQVRSGSLARKFALEWLISKCAHTGTTCRERYCHRYFRRAVRPATGTLHRELRATGDWTGACDIEGDQGIGICRY